MTGLAEKRRARRSVVRPQAAAGIVLLRRSAKGAEVLLGRRNARLRFMPGYYVFPGGRLDPGDRQASGFAEPPSPAPGPGADGLTARLFPALRRAAIRETWEETGLLLADSEASLAGDTESTPGVWQDYRRAGLAPAFGQLSFVARAITPPQSPIRFHSRFFLCCTNEVAVGGRLAGDGELEDLDWRPARSLDALPMADVTRAVLQEALHRLEQPERPACLFLYRQGRIRRR